MFAMPLQASAEWPDLTSPLTTFVSFGLCRGQHEGGDMEETAFDPQILGC